MRAGPSCKRPILRREHVDDARRNAAMQHMRRRGRLEYSTWYSTTIVLKLGPSRIRVSGPLVLRAATCPAPPPSAAPGAPRPPSELDPASRSRHLGHRAASDRDGTRRRREKKSCTRCEKKSDNLLVHGTVYTVDLGSRSILSGPVYGTAAYGTPTAATRVSRYGRPDTSAPHHILHDHPRSVL